MPTRARSFGKFVFGSLTLMPSTTMLPSWNGSSALTTLISVDLPDPDGPHTTIKVVNALEPFQEGNIVVDGIKVNDPKTNLKKLRARVGMVFQHFELFPHLTITQNLTLGQIKVLGRTPEEAKTRGLKYLDRVGLIEQKDKFPGQLSGGQQQRVAIARALSMDPICMLFANKVANRVIFMDRGQIVEDATKADFFGKPRSERAQQFLAKILHH